MASRYSLHSIKEIREDFNNNSFGPAGPISLKNVHWTFFRALDVLISNSSFNQHPSSIHAPGISIATSTATTMDAGTPVLTMSPKL